MPVRSVLDIDVNDDAFKAFLALFDKYKDAVGKLPGAWSTVNAATAAGKATFVELAASLMAQTELLHEARLEAEQLNRAGQQSKRDMASMERSTHNVEKNISGATKSLLKWTGVTTVLGTLFGAGGLYGIDRLMVTASGLRRSSLGLGVSPGELQSFGLNFGRVVDPQSFLAGVNRAKNDVNFQWGLIGSGLNPGWAQSHDTTEVAAALLPQLKRLVDSAAPGQLQQRLDASGASNFIGLEEAQRLRNTSWDELFGPNGQLAKYARQVKQLQLNDQQLRAWLDFNQALDVASYKIRNAFIDALSPKLIGSLSQLSNAVSSVVSAFLKNPETGKWIDDFSAALGRFASHLGTKEFSDDAQSFAHYVGVLARVVKELVLDLVELNSGLSWLHGKSVAAADSGIFDWLGRTQSQMARETRALPQSGAGGWAHNAINRAWNWVTGSAGSAVGPSTGSVSSGSVDSSITSAVNYFMGKGLSREAATGIAARLAMESGSGRRIDPGAVNPTSGAYGAAQWLGSRKSAAMATGGDLQKQLDLVWQELQTTEAGSLSGIKGAKTAEDAARAMEAFERAGNPAFTEQGAALASRLMRSTTVTSGGSAPSLAIGDSIAAGLIRYGHLAGREAPFGKPGATGTARVGASTSEVLDRINAILAADPNALRGKMVALSTGASNSPSVLGPVSEQLRILQQAGANVDVLGVGTRGDFGGVNDKLRSLADKFQDVFTPLANVGRDQVHPTDWNAVARSLQPAPLRSPGAFMATAGGAMSHLAAQRVLVDVRLPTGAQATIAGNQAGQ